MTEVVVEGDAPPWTLTDRLRKAREHRGLDQAQLADLMGVSPRSIRNYESGSTTPRRPQLIAWAFATGVSLAWLEECAISDSKPESPHLRFGESHVWADNGDLGSVTCPRCGRTSYHPDDVREGYCGACHDWTSAPVHADDLAAAA